ncbi:MAG TPA: hypothetical protein VIK60_04480 [Vicinamibacterales bacterium]
MKKTQHRRFANPLLQWVFSRQNTIVTCRLDQRGGHYRVSLIPHRDTRKTIIDVFEEGLSAFRRHAALAAELRRAGWMLVAYR